ncbi:MAG: thermonuclease family protein [Chloroflexota bacterium]|nr:thermonuclease family protein [Chloroflexota bacterium]
MTSEMPTRLWVYRAKLERIIDGDSLVTVIDAGFGVHIGRGNEGAHLRLIGVDTPERNEPGWKEARDFTEYWIPISSIHRAWPLRIETERADSFGRYLAVVYNASTGECLNDALLEAGHAIRWERK